MKNKILSLIPTECPWRDTLYWFDTIGSTNDQAKIMAQSGAPHGTVLIAGQQTEGRGRMGRSFHSPVGKGLYLSVILRPSCDAQQLMHLTCAAAVASCNAIVKITGYRPGIKWINDLVADSKKLGGILTELSIEPKSGTVAYAIIGIGINCTHTHEDFPPELRQIATSLQMVTQKHISSAQVAAAMVCALQKMDTDLLANKDAIMANYRKNCITLGQQIILLRADEKRYGTTLDIDNDGGLIVQFEDGALETVNSGEVSIRGMYGYI